MIQQVIAQLTGVHRLIVQLLFGSGLRLVECMRLRVKDLGFDQRQTGESPRHPHCAGTPRPQERQNHDGLHPRPQPGRLGRSQLLGLTNSRGLTRPRIVVATG
jgi:integrase